LNSAQSPFDTTRPTSLCSLRTPWWFLCTLTGGSRKPDVPACADSKGPRASLSCSRARSLVLPLRCRVGSSRQGLRAGPCASSPWRSCARSGIPRFLGAMGGGQTLRTVRCLTRRYTPLLSTYSVVRPSREANHRALLRRRARQGSNP
jgi:hypothetical protein